MEKINVSYTPAQLRFPLYVLKGTLETQGREEAAARLLEFYQRANSWNPVPWKKIHQKMGEDLRAWKDKKPQEGLSTIWTYGPSGVQSVVNGFHELIGTGHLVLVKDDDGEEFIQATQLLAEAVQKFAK